MRGIGQAPIVMRRELDGFVMNRMQGALLEEAFRLVADGYCTIEDVDIGLRDGLALRWSFMGPFETIDLNAPGGVRDYAARYQQIYERLFPSMQRRVDWAGPVLATVEQRAPRQAAGRPAGRAPALARPPPDGAAQAQAQRRAGHRRADMADTRKVIITCAVTGAIHTPSMSPHLPVTAGGDRRRGDRGRRGRGRHRPPARARPGDRPARPDARGVRAVPAGDQAALATA